ncbi:MAG: hypothetical protein AAF542_17545 [Pseudomonadota bacterium]
MGSTDNNDDPLDFEAAAKSMDPQLQAALTQGRWHLLGLLGIVILFAAADSWSTLTDLAVAEGFAVLAAILAGVGLAHLMHEWGHFLGARWSGANAPLKAEPALLAYDFDFKSNTNDHFLAMSYGGTLGNFLAIALIWWTIPMDEPHRIALLASAIAATGFVAKLEWPVILHARENKDPMAALIHGFGGGLPTFRNALLVGGTVGLIAYWML